MLRVALHAQWDGRACRPLKLPSSCFPAVLPFESLRTVSSASGSAPHRRRCPPRQISLNELHMQLGMQDFQQIPLLGPFRLVLPSHLGRSELWQPRVGCLPAQQKTQRAVKQEVEHKTRTKLTCLTSAVNFIILPFHFRGRHLCDSECIIICSHSFQ